MGTRWAHNRGGFRRVGCGPGGVELIEAVVAGAALVRPDGAAMAGSAVARGALSEVGGLSVHADMMRAGRALHARRRASGRPAASGTGSDRARRAAGHGVGASAQAAAIRGRSVVIAGTAHGQPGGGGGRGGRRSGRGVAPTTLLAKPGTSLGAHIHAPSIQPSAWPRRYASPASDEHVGLSGDRQATPSA